GDDFFDLVNDRTFFLRFIVEHGDAVGHAVAEPFPVALIAFLDDRRVLRAHIRVYQHAGADAEFVEHIHDAKHTYTRAIVTQSVAGHIRRVAAARAADRPVEMEILDVRRDPGRNATMIGPFNLGPADNR